MKSIAVIPKSTTQVFWKAVEAGAREGANEAGMVMVWKGSLNEDDPAQQIRIVEQFVSEGVGGIVLAPIDDTALKRPVAAAMQKGIPVVIMDSPLKGEPVKDFVSTVSTNNHRGGEMAGEQLGKLVTGLASFGSAWSLANGARSHLQSRTTMGRTVASPRVCRAG